MSTEPARPSSHHLTATAAVILTVLVGAYLLRVASPVAIPVVTSFVSATLVWPIHQFFRRRLPRRWQPLAVAPAMGVLVAAASIVLLVAWSAWAMSSDQLPKARDAFEQQSQQIQGWLNARGIEISPDRLVQSAMTAAHSFANSLVAFLGNAVLVFFLTLLILLEVPGWCDKLRRIFGHGTGERVVTMFHDAGRQVRRYLAIKTIMSALTAILAGTWMAIMGVPLWPVWALANFVLNFIPNVGSILAAVGPTSAVLVSGGFSRGVLVVGGLTLIEQVMGNLVEPRFEGKRLDLAPSVVLVAVIFFGWLWGAMGVFLAVPVTAAIIAALEAWPQTRPAAELAQDSADS